MITDSKLPIVRDEIESKIRVNQNLTDESVWLDTDDETEIRNPTEFGKTKPSPRSAQVELSALKMQHKGWKERHKGCGPILDGGAIRKQILVRELSEGSLNKEILNEKWMSKNNICIGLAHEHQHTQNSSNGRYWGDFVGK